MFKNLYLEFKRILPLLLIILAAIIAFGDVSQLQVQLYQLSMIAFVIAFMHFVRSWLFPYINLGEMISYTKYNAIASAMVFTAMLLFLLGIIYIGVVK